MRSIIVLLAVTCLSACAGMQEQYAAQQAAEAERQEQESQAMSMAVQNYGNCLNREWGRALSANYNNTNAYNFGLSNCTFERDIVCTLVGHYSCHSELASMTPMMFLQASQNR